MDKDKSLQLKGVAILMMLFLHLFNTLERVGECTTYINFLNGKPLVYAVARVCGLCVPIYLFISGYGLTKSKNLDTTALFRRLRRVYSHYWLVFAIFIPLGCIVVPSVYPGNVLECVLNFFSVSVSYNGEWWFLLPYALLLFLARWLVPLVRRCSSWQNALVFALLYGLSVFAMNTKGEWDDNLLWLRTLHLLLVFPAFYAGAYCASHLPEKCWTVGSQKWPLGWLALLVFVRCFIGASIVNVLFCIPCILFFAQLHVPSSLQAFLRFFGHYSTFMWLTHTFYAYYFFHEDLYNLHYPLIIYVVLVFVSLLTAMGLDGVYKLLEK